MREAHKAQRSCVKEQHKTRIQSHPSQSSLTFVQNLQVLFLHLPLPLSPELSSLETSLQPLSSRYCHLLRWRLRLTRILISQKFRVIFQLCRHSYWSCYYFSLCSGWSWVGFEWSIHLYFSISPVLFVCAISYSLRFSKFLCLEETPELAARPKGLNFIQLPQDSCSPVQHWDAVRTQLLTASAMLTDII